MYQRNCFSCDGRRNSGSIGKLLGPTGATGPTGNAGPTGAGLQSTTAFSLAAAPNYKTGQVVTYTSSGYVVKKDAPQGFPNVSQDYIVLVEGGPTGTTGTTGSTGIYWFYWNHWFYRISPELLESLVLPELLVLLESLVLPELLVLLESLVLPDTTGTTGATGSTGTTGPAGSSTAKSIVFQGTNAGFQRIAGSPGIDSNVIPYVTAGAGNIVGFATSININNLPAAVYTIDICRNVPTNLSAPTSSYILSTITLTTTDKITGTMTFSIKPTDIGSRQPQVYNPTPAPGPATVTWTSITTGNLFSRGDAISLYITPGITASAVYSIFLITDI